MFPEEHIIELTVGENPDGQAVIGVSVNANMGPQAMGYDDMRRGSLGRRGVTDMMRGPGRPSGNNRGYFNDDSYEDVDEQDDDEQDNDDRYYRRNPGYFTDNGFTGDL